MQSVGFKTARFERLRAGLHTKGSVQPDQTDASTFGQQLHLVIIALFRMELMLSKSLRGTQIQKTALRAIASMCYKLKMLGCV